MKAFPRALGLFALITLACDKRDVSVSHVATTDEMYMLTSSWPTFAQGVDQGPSAKMDILFMVDNSPSMAPLQAKLAAAFPDLMKVLQSLPSGVPDLHIGVVSSDMGAGVFGDEQVPGCRHGGDGGRLQVAARAGCTVTGLTDAFISVHADPSTGALVTNYGDQALPDVFSCIALLGQDGCGFEQPFASVRRALDPALAPAENAGFLRADAYLAVVLLSNEDDCSVPADSQLFNPKSNSLAGEYGPLTSFRCNYFGHHVDGKGQPPSMTEAKLYQKAESAENGPLDSVADFVAFLKSLKGDPARVLVATIAGPPSPYVVDLVPAPIAGGEQWPEIAHSCTQPDGTFADPGVRLWGALQSFGKRGVFESICNNSSTPALQRIAETLVGPLLPPCVAVPAGGPGCTVIDRWVDADNKKQAARVPSCSEGGGYKPCWDFAADDAACLHDEKHIVVDRTGTTPPEHLFTAVDCTTAP
jgi:hypothetical protein